jgi:hypothetical protein
MSKKTRVIVPIEEKKGNLHKEDRAGESDSEFLKVDRECLANT